MNITEARNDEDKELNFAFTPIDDPSHFANIFQKENFKTLEKWGLIQNMELIKFRFNIKFDLKDLDKFLRNFFNDKNVRQYFPIINSVIPENSNSIERIKYNKLGTRATNLDIFNTLYENGVCSSETGYIKKDFDDYVDDVLVSDKLKAALIKEESESYCLFNEETRNELLFHIFKRLVVGGSLCQYEDSVNEYLDLVKMFYKGIVWLI